MAKASNRRAWFCGASRVRDRRGSARARRRRPEHGVIDPEVDRPYAALRDAQALDDGSGRVLGDRDHERAPAHRGAVCSAPVEALGSREEPRKELVLQVEHGGDRRGPAHGRNHHGEREVHRIETGQARAEASATDDALGHREHPAGISATRGSPPPPRSEGRRRPARCGGGARGTRVTPRPRARGRARGRTSRCRPRSVGRVRSPMPTRTSDECCHDLARP